MTNSPIGSYDFWLDPGGGRSQILAQIEGRPPPFSTHDARLVLSFSQAAFLSLGNIMGGRA